MNTKQKFVAWEDRFSVNIPIVDSQHKHLIDMTNELHDACRLNDTFAKDQFRKTIQDAVAYIKHHFSTEEQIMEKIAYPGLAEQKKLHVEFIKEVLKNVAAFEEGKKFIPSLFVRFLRDWVLSHIAIVDSKLGHFLADLQKKGKIGIITMKRKNEGGTENQIVLAVDDSKTQLVQYKNILPMYDLFTCESPLQALEMMKTMEIDIVLLDLAMEEMNGFEFLQQLRKEPKKHRVPVIVVSGNNVEKYITASIKLGADDFIAKPVEPELLLKKIKMRLDKVKQAAKNIPA